MEPEPEPIDLSALDPSRDRAHWDAAIAHVADRAVVLARLRRRITRRGAIAVGLAAAAVLALWLSTSTAKIPGSETGTAATRWVRISSWPGG